MTYNSNRNLGCCVMLCRHAETYGNARQFKQMQPDEHVADSDLNPSGHQNLGDLNPYGQAQSLALANHLEGTQLHMILCSSLARARQTVVPLVDALQPTPEVEVVQELDELDVTATEYGLLLSGAAIPHSSDLRTKLDEFDLRLDRVRQRICSLPTGVTALLVSHAGTNGALIAGARSDTIRPWPRQFNACLNRVEFKDGLRATTPAFVNSTHHLPQHLVRPWRQPEAVREQHPEIHR